MGSRVFGEDKDIRDVFRHKAYSSARDIKFFQGTLVYKKPKNNTFISMDNVWTCLIEEMWESYLCEENIGSSSFYGTNPDDPLSGMFDEHFDQLYPFEEAELLLENTEQICPDDEDMQPLGNIFQLMEDAALFIDHAKLKDDEKNNSNCNQLTSSHEEKEKNDAATNTDNKRKLKAISKSKLDGKQKKNSGSRKRKREGKME